MTQIRPPAPLQLAPLALAGVAAGLALAAIGPAPVGLGIAGTSLVAAVWLTLRGTAAMRDELTRLAEQPPVVLAPEDGAQTNVAHQDVAHEAVLDAIRYGVLVVDAERRITYMNDAACRLMGMTREESLGHPSGRDVLQFVDQMGRPLAADELPSGMAAAGREVDDQVVGTTRRDGSRVWVRCASRLVRSSTGERLAVISLNDVTSRVEADMAAEAETAQLRHRALHDSLTGLPNRTMLMDRLSQARLSAERRGSGTGLVVIDLDGFKAVNDTLGHAAGDEVLVQVAVRLRTALRAVDTAARLGGDEFVVLCEDLNPTLAELELSRIAERVTNLLNQPYITSLGPADVGASLGFAVAGPDEELSLDLVTQADEAMLHEKRERKRTRSSEMREVTGPLPQAAPTSLSVFIIDDDPAMRLLANRIIEADPTNGLTVVGEAAEGRSGIEQVLATRPDLVLCDVMMPGLTGPQVVTAIREQAPSQRVIFWSATTAPELERFQQELGVPYVLKDRIEELPVALLDAAAQAAAGEPLPMPQG